MGRGPIIGLGLGVLAFVALVLTAGSIASPTMPSGMSYELAEPTKTTLATVPEMELSMELPESVDSGGGVPLGPLGFVGVFGLLLLILLPTLRTSGVAFVGLLAAGFIIVGAFIAQTQIAGGSSSIFDNPGAYFDRVALILIATVALLGSTLLLIPDDRTILDDTLRRATTVRSAVTGSESDTHTGLVYAGSQIDDHVLEAWSEIQERIDAAESQTPNETARRAISAGLPADAVKTITRAFETARYGSKSSSEPNSDQIRLARDRLVSSEALDEEAE